ncbi:hypothetical protein [Ruminococcus sp.]|uniref:hypothetical protein n=1 Tax=Ruminococcus sp. TaxID=41978 RepID=UPI0039A0D4F2
MATYRKRMASREFAGWHCTEKPVATYRKRMALARKVMATHRKRMALYRKSAKHPALSGRIKLGTTVLSKRAAGGIPFMLLCLFTGSWSGLRKSKLHKYGNKKRVKRMKKTIAITEECNQLLKKS